MEGNRVETIFNDELTKMEFSMVGTILKECVGRQITVGGISRVTKQVYSHSTLTVDTVSRKVRFTAYDKKPFKYMERVIDKEVGGANSNTALEVVDKMLADDNITGTNMKELMFRLIFIVMDLSELNE